MRKNAVVVAIVMLLVGIGCATVDTHPRDAQGIGVTFDKWKAGVEAGDWEKVLAISAKVKEDIGPKFFKGAKVDASNAKITYVDEDTAKYAPVVINGNGGKVTLEIELLKEKGHWYVLHLWEM